MTAAAAAGGTGPSAEAASDRVRFRFAKLGKIRFTSHRDVARMWERALRRARLPLAYTAGFSPRPQLSFGLALPTGCESTAEYLDVAFRAALAPAELVPALNPLLPEGVEVLAAAGVEAGRGSLQELVDGCSWELAVPGVDVVELQARLDAALAAEHIPVERERKAHRVVDDLRPSLLELSARPGAGGEAVLVADVATRPRGVRPVELGGGLGLPVGRARRTCQWIERDGSRHEPLAAPAAGAARLAEHAL